MGTIVDAGREWYSGFAQNFDAAAGSTDESVARQFDDTPGGGFADLDTYTEGPLYTDARLENAVDEWTEGTARQFDAIAGSTDESVARQFDDEEGGGFTDVVIGTDNPIHNQFDDEEGGGFADGDNPVGEAMRSLVAVAGIGVGIYVLSLLQPVIRVFASLLGAGE